MDKIGSRAECLKTGYTGTIGAISIPDNPNQKKLVRIIYNSGQSVDHSFETEYYNIKLIK